MFFLQRISQKCTLRRLALSKVWLFISYTKINLPNQLFNILICIILSFTKFVCWAIVCFVLKVWCICTKSAIFLKIFRLLQFLSSFYHCFKAAAKTNTIFHYGNNCARRFVNHKYYSNFIGTVPTFGFRISIVENVRSQNFMKNWLSEVQKSYRIRLLYFSNALRMYPYNIYW